MDLGRSGKAALRAFKRLQLQSLFEKDSILRRKNIIDDPSDPNQGMTKKPFGVTLREQVELARNKNKVEEWEHAIIDRGIQKKK